MFEQKSSQEYTPEILQAFQFLKNKLPVGLAIKLDEIDIEFSKKISEKIARDCEYYEENKNGTKGVSFKLA
ncbi:MAG: hypothetical protein ACTSX6_03990 [Candidatus Heimdallarchaeaceae archaeon]